MIKKFIKSKPWLYQPAFFFRNLPEETRSFFPSIFGFPPGPPPFNGNDKLQKAVAEIARIFPITAAVETGTHQGGTTHFLVNTFSSCNIYTCEVMGMYRRESRYRFRDNARVSISPLSSEKFVEDLLDRNIVGDFPFIFLDAHWYFYWPLKDELIAMKKLKHFACVIDDFEVPGKPFIFDSYEGIKNDVEFVKPFLPTATRIFFPSYPADEKHPIGHVILVRGVDGPISLPEYEEYKAVF